MRNGISSPRRERARFDLFRDVLQHRQDRFTVAGVLLDTLDDRLNGVSRAHFWNVMKGRRSPTLRWIARLAVALEVDPSELIAPDRPPAKGRRSHRQ
jgi:hypothetical protein